MKKLLGSLCGLLFAAHAAADPFAIDFSDRPYYIPNNVVVLTFDDGPDWNNTSRVLDVLRDKNVRASFFINSENWSSLSQDEPMRDLVRRMVNEGHILGNHTVHHPHLGDLSNSDVENEISGVENVVRDIFGGGGPRLSLLRAPHGEPYQNHDGNYDRITSIVGRHAVHIGWAIDSFDYNCPAGDAGCVYNQVTGPLQSPGQGSYGVILMHSVHSQTAFALPGIIDYIRSHGFQIWTTEDVVRARYGASSAQLIGGGGGGGGGPTPPPPPSGGPLPSANEAYHLIARHSGKCLDVNAWSQDDRANIIQWSCHGGANQTYRLQDAGNGGYYLVAQHSGKCVDVDAAGTDNGTNIQQYTCNGTNAQRVSLNATSGGFYNVRFANSGKCLDVSGPSADDGANVHLWDCVGGSNQEWSFQR